MQKIKRLAASLIAGLTSAAMLAAPVAAATTTLVVTPTNGQGWVFNGDPANATPYEFNEDQASTGEGSLYVEPIDNVGPHKFIAALPLGVEVAEMDSVSYDFMISGDGTIDDAEHYYLNVYTNIAGSTTFYECRFDYTPTTGSTTGFTTTTFSASNTPTAVDDRFDGNPRTDDGFDCPETLEEMPEGSTISAITLNVGDTSVNDAGLAGYFDNVVLSIGDDVTTYDFELVDYVSSKDECKNGGWEAGLANGSQFKNQGDCVSYFASNTRNQPAYANQSQLRF